MVVCKSCGRHHHEGPCPFCSTKSGVKKVTQAAAVCFSAMFLMACYGAPPEDTDTSEDTAAPTQDIQDIDGDGFTIDQGDCDDTDPEIGPENCE